MTSILRQPSDQVVLDEKPRVKPFNSWLRKQLTADFAPLPVLASLAIIGAIFQSLNHRFLSSENLSNLVAQIVPLAFIAAGTVLILLIGEIDLSVGIVSGLAAAVTAVLNAQMGLPAWAAIIGGLLAGAAIGLFNGAFVTRFRLPSFVVTLAGLLTWQGVMFTVLGSNGTVNITDGGLTWIAAMYLSAEMGYALGCLGIVAYALSLFLARRRRGKLGLPQSSIRVISLRVFVLAIVVLLSVVVLNAARGISASLVMLLVVLVALDVMTRRRRFGRHMFAIGGNAEAAGRTGVHIIRVRITVFMLGSTLAAAGGIFAASRLLAVSTSSGGGDVLLNAIASAVIGGTSLFGGRGSAWAALLGALVIGCISNGMDLLSFGPSTKFIVTGLVLLGALTVDATLRNRYRGRS